MVQKLVHLADQAAAAAQVLLEDLELQIKVILVVMLILLQHIMQAAEEAGRPARWRRH